MQEMGGKESWRGDEGRDEGQRVGGMKRGRGRECGKERERGREGRRETEKGRREGGRARA